MVRGRIFDPQYLQLPPHLEDLSEDSFGYHQQWWNFSKPFLRGNVKNFESSLKKWTGFSDRKRPDGKVETPIRTGSIRFIVSTEPTHKTPDYSTICNEFSNYVDFLIEQHTRDVRRRDVRTFEGEPFISHDILLEKMDSMKKEMLSGKEGIKQRIESNDSKMKDKIPENLDIPLRNYGNLSGSNAEIIILSGNMLDEGKKRITGFSRGKGSNRTHYPRFRELLLEDSLQTLGLLSSDYEELLKLPKDQEKIVDYMFGDSSCYKNLLVRQDRTSYSKILDGFIKEPPSRPKKDSNIGDFILIDTMLKDKDMFGRLQDLGFYDTEFTETYDLKRRGDKLYMSLKGLRKKMGIYADDATNVNVRQNVLKLY